LERKLAKKRIETHGPEWHIQQAIIKKLRSLGWHVVVTHGNMFQQGLPDLFCCHKMYGIRLVEVKNPLSYRFTPAQVHQFPLLYANGCQVHVLVEIAKLFKPSNYHHYMRNFRAVR
jgi:hypothetical protein